MSPTDSVWQRTRDWWSQRASQLTYLFLSDPGASPPTPDGSYLRLWLADMFLAQARRRAADVYPSLRASVRLSFGTSEGVTLSTVVSGTESGPGLGPGTYSRRLTGLVPFRGGTVAVQAGLYQLRGTDHLRLAFDILAGFSSLVVPPLASAAAVAEKVAHGIDKAEAALQKAGGGPRLVLSREYAATGPVGDALMPGHIVLIGATRAELDPAKLAMVGGRLCRGNTPLEGHDYLVIRLETLRERDDWRFPEWDRLIREAKEARIRGEDLRHSRLRTEVLAQVAISPDLTPIDRNRVNDLIQKELDATGYGAVGADEFTSLHDLITARGLPPAAAVESLQLADFLR